MTSDLMIFKNDQFGNFRGILIDNEPWFVGKDVAAALVYSDANKAISMHGL